MKVLGSQKLLSLFSLSRFVEPGRRHGGGKTVLPDVHRRARGNSYFIGAGATGFDDLAEVPSTFLVVGGPLKILSVAFCCQGSC